MLALVGCTFDTAGTKTSQGSATIAGGDGSSTSTSAGGSSGSPSGTSGASGGASHGATSSPPPGSTTASSATGPEDTGSFTTSPATTGPDTSGTTTGPDTSGATTTGRPPGPTPYGSCSQSQCEVDGELCMTANPYNVCSMPCNDIGDCPMPPGGSATLVCDFTPGPDLYLCWLRCNQPDECPDGMVCNPYGDCSWD